MRGSGFVNIGRIFNANKENSDDMVGKDFDPLYNKSQSLKSTINSQGNQRVQSSQQFRGTVAENDRQVSGMQPQANGGTPAGRGLDSALFRHNAGPRFDELKSGFSNLTQMLGQKDADVHANPWKPVSMTQAVPEPVAENPYPGRAPMMNHNGTGIQAISDGKQAMHDGFYYEWLAAGSPVPYEKWKRDTGRQSPKGM